ncbi:phosphoenolpyruvate--protein phosphotransferase [Shewanella sp. Isolate11]|uniref:phosphoenolpyruvate--protein phosphotransferase n=1 Tax=Shewanella sp. Isolate11 TaxID=2908530 RepID=UPI001EFE1511|nr:phosphoenolpyruvate--protein phosphotransferase [Shewanella sp. Isolate11]MCG9696766.1 phosphoenolpyruvate--protein phosphotransferase [Shewanella sp. Isolate11]
MIIKGIAVSAGIALGQAKVFRPLDCPLDYHLLPPSKLKQECRHLQQALNNLIEQIKTSAKHLNVDSEHYQLIEADLLLLEDEELQQELINTITQLQFSAALAVEHTFAKQAQAMREMNSAYLSCRAEDVLSLGQRLVNLLLTGECVQLSALPDNCIVLAKDITPAEFATLPLDKIAGLVLQTGGVTSHTAILARSAAIPTLMSCPCDLDIIIDGTTVAIDALQGEVIIEPTADQIELLQQLQQQAIQRKLGLEKFKHQLTQTQDGHQVALLANVGSISEINHLAEVGAEGVGLFRTEFMFMNSDQLPDEEQQYRLYCDALRLLDGKPLTIRTIDLGADKDVPSLTMPKEENPALGVRGIRYTLSHTALFRSQLQAILRAANHGPIRLMFPMVNQVEELDTVFEIIEQCKLALNEAEQGYGDVELGIVVETPAAVINLESMLPLLDFISIGTNDLTQYAMAADRTNPYFINKYPVLSPAIVKLIAQTINSAKQQNITVSVCGELASNPIAAPLLIGLGVDELSVSIASLLEVKQALSQWCYEDCVTLAQQATVTTRIAELNQLLTCCHS